MNMPGFTAVASLFNVSANYQTTAEATVYGGIVRPAGDVFLPDRPPPSITPVRWNCLKRVCTVSEHYPGFPVWECRWVPSIC
jgi:hypothetical protein